MPDEPTRYERGLRKLSEIHGTTGEEIVNALGDLGRYIVEFAFGDIYSRDGLSLRERQMLTVAMLTVLAGREPQLRVHLHAALKMGIPFEQLVEVILHTVPYAGFPTAMNALTLLKAVAEEDS